VPVVIAVLVAAVVVTTVLALAARTGRALDPADVGDGAKDLLVAEARRHPRFQHFLLERRDPAKATGLALTVALGLSALATLAIGLLLEMVQTNQGFARWDNAAARWGAAHSGGTAKTILLWVTTLGSTPFIIGVVIVVGLVEFVRLRTKAAPLFVATVAVAELLLNNLVKTVVSRARPDIHRVVHASGYSFPSGHTAAAAATYAAVALLLGRRRSRRTKALLAGAAGGITVAVASSRVLLGAHWLTDVLAGASLGWGVFALCSIAYGGRLLRFGEPVKKAQETAVAEIHSTAGSTR
jgi:membrane-associated phospholipid phosphatase